MITTEVAFARSTWEQARAFNEGLYELSRRMPMELVRLYVLEGTRSPRVHTSCYNYIDDLSRLRTRAILQEMGSVEAQAELWLEEHPDDACALAAKEGRTVATAEMLLGTHVMDGTSNAAGFSAETYGIAPSLRVYELFSWHSPGEARL